MFLNTEIPRIPVNFSCNAILKKGCLSVRPWYLTQYHDVDKLHRHTS
ncbi:hypothetical protein SAMN06265376_106149 [Dokdonia pacifica]|uniref:Uncharacterized protein n=1 Tax=Dokdonia pacifica TaxID=1627892 RepID=A0A239BHG2_9FLAO|nr:hypothetical protein SAMN06265376_106149 [Dokdonia pacifica]